MRLRIVLFLFMVVLLGAGCADFKSYMKDRGNDLADCFTARVGTCYGIGVRAQVTNYLSAAVLGCIEENEVGYLGRNYVRTKEGLWCGVTVPQLLGPVIGIVKAIGGVHFPADHVEGLKYFFG